MSFFSHAVSAKLGNNNRLTKLNALLDWSKIEKHLSKIYEGKRKEVGGVKPYNALSMYKAILLQAWHSLSDPQLEEALRVRIDFMEFTGFTLETHAPDETTFCRFRNRLVELELDQILMNEINNQLSFSGLKIEKSNGAVIDATIVESAARPKQQIEISDDRNEVEKAPQINISESCDPDAKWLKKGKKCFFGYKVFSVVQEKEGFIEHVEVKSANHSEVKNFSNVIGKLAPIKGRRIYGDKGFCSEENREYLKKTDYKDGIMEKATRSHDLTHFQKIKNKLISKKRFIVEQSYGTLKRLFKFCRASYMTINKVKGEALRKAICFNLLKALNKVTLPIDKMNNFQPGDVK